MESGKRMDKYSEGNIAVKERTAKNINLYNDDNKVDINYVDLNNAIVIEDNNLDNTRESYKKKKELEMFLEKKEEEKQDKTHENSDDEEAQKNYDINEILKLAKENKLFEDNKKKRLINTEYNILTKLDVDTIEKSKDMSKENLKGLIDSIYKSEDLINKEKEDNQKELFEDFVDNTDKNETIATEVEPTLIEKEITKRVIEANKTKEAEETKEKEEKITKNSDVTENATLKNNDAEDDDFDSIDSSKTTIIAIIIVIIIFVIIGYIVYKYFLL